MVELIPNALTLDETIFRRAAKRFRAAFESAWLRIPVAARNEIQRYLLTAPASLHVCFRMDYRESPQEPFGRFIWFDDRTVFTFLAPFVERATPVECVSAAIAHELGHCFHRATGTWDTNLDVEEENVRRTAASWRFEDPGFPNEAARIAWDQDAESWRKNHVGESKYTERFFVK